MKKFFIIVSVLFIFAATTTVNSHAETRLRMSTTTSTENSGLLPVIITPFEKANDVKIDVIAVGTGAALKLGENGDVDLVFVHSRPDEDKFVASGFGIDRRDVMHNDFVILGPKNDPENLKGAGSALEAFKRLGAGKCEFISRGDNSGTHIKEKELWKLAGVSPSGSPLAKWYVETGQGMGAVLQIANDKQAYTLADRGTYIAYEKKVDLVILYEGDKTLYNPYGIIAVNPAKFPHVKYDLAKKFIEYITSSEGQKIIADFKVNGKELFFPDAIKN
ncbi:MAG: substrate-binding domain-containing protein [Candidatus Schekmanbacteria bacterium]|nr:substrate-binding domain-containing protein [Candidatus Schekmanbacteria bacterium]